MINDPVPYAVETISRETWIRAGLAHSRLCWQPVMTAASQSPASTDLMARCVATRLELHAVSRKNDGPLRSKANATRFAIV